MRICSLGNSLRTVGCALLLAVFVLLCAAMPGQAWAVELSGSGNQDDPYLISSVDDLIAFRDSVNAGDTKYNDEGVHVALGASIDLAGVDWSVNIGDDCSMTFDGIFDGRGNTIYNLTSTETAQKGDGYICTGLFGAIYGSAVVKNLTLENVSINTGDFSGNNVGAVVGFAYSCIGSVENVKVIGNISITASGASSVGAVVGYAYGGSLTVANCEVGGNAGSSIFGKSQVGGLVGYGGGRLKVENCSVRDVSVDGTGLVGGLVGILCGGSVAGGSVSNVGLVVTGEFWQNSVAIAAGSISEVSTVSGVSFSAVTANGSATSRMVGSEYVNKPTAEVDAICARVGDVYHLEFEEAVDAAQGGDTVTLLSDVEITSTIEIDEELTLDLNGFSIDADVADERGAVYVDAKGDLTVKDSTAGENGIGDGKISNKSGHAIANHGKASVQGGRVDVILNSGELDVSGGSVRTLDNSGSFIVSGGRIGDLVVRDESGAPDVPGAGGGKVTGGIFSEKIPESLIAEGYELKELGDGTYAVLPLNSSDGGEGDAPEPAGPNGKDESKPVTKDELAKTGDATGIAAAGAGIALVAAGAIALIARRRAA